MAELLRDPWLGRTIEQELSEVLERWSKGEAKGSQSEGSTRDLSFEDDGSNLRIRSWRTRVVQIVKFLSYEEPLQPVLSDSVNRINTTICKEAARRYTNKTRKRFTDGIVGGLLQLLDFEIVATHIGSRSSRITLFVMDFKCLGSNGSNAYGVPQAIEDRPQLSKLIAKLKDYREQATSCRAPSTQRTPNEASSLASQPNSEFKYTNLEASQATFATQAPPQKVFSGGVAKAKDTSNRTGISPQISDQAPERCEIPGLIDHEDQNEGAVKNKTGFPVPGDGQNLPINGKKPQPTTHNDLLGILMQAQRVPKTKLAPIAAAPALPADNLNRDLRTSITPTTTHSPLATDIGPVSSPRRQSLSPQQSRNPNAMTEDDRRHPIMQINRKVPSAIYNSASQRNGISSRDIKIAKNQLELLNREDSWLPAQPGQREPSAHVPISLLRFLNQEADARAKLDVFSHTSLSRTSPSKEREKSHSPASLDDDVQKGQISESDSPISASEWPPSPQGPQLPPDSSMESADFGTNAELQRRKSSSAPASSQGLQSNRSSPLPDIGSTQRLIQVSLGMNTSQRSLASGSPLGTPESRSGISSPRSVRSRSAKANGGFVAKESLPGDDSSQPGIQEAESSKMHGNEHQVQFLSNSLAPTADSSASHSSPPIKSKEAQRVEESSAVYSIPSSPTSDLEMEIPLPLGTKAGSQDFPSTASQSMEPFTQVKRTPYVDGRRHSLSPIRSKLRSSPSNFYSPEFQRNSNLLEEVIHVSQSTPSAMETSSSEARLNRPDNEVPLHTNISASSHADSAANNTAMGYTLREEGTVNRTLNPDTDHSVESIDISPISVTVAKEQGRSSPNTDIPMHINGGDEHETKRKASNDNILSPNVAKRRKRLKVPRAFDSIETHRERPDPKEAAKRYRQDFLDSRKIRNIEKTPMHSIATSTDQVESGEARITPPDDVYAHGEQSYIESTNRPVPMDLETSLPGVEEYQHTDVVLDSRRSVDPVSKSPTNRYTYDLQEISTDTRENLDLLPMDDDTNPGPLNNGTLDADTNDFEQEMVDPVSAQMNGFEPNLSEDMCKLVPNVEPPDPDMVPQSSSGQELENTDAHDSQPRHPAQELKKSADVPKHRDSPAGPVRAAALSPDVSILLGQSSASRSASPDLHGNAGPPEKPMLGIEPKMPKVENSVTNRGSGPGHQLQPIFDRFKTVYPNYPGDQKHFIAVCKKINNLVSNNRMEHPSLWDDFIIRHKLDYLQYMRRCEEDVEDPMRYEDFYRTEIERPLHLKYVVTKMNLKDILSVGDQNRIKAEEQPRKESSTSIQLPNPYPEPPKISVKNEKPPASRVASIERQSSRSPVVSPSTSAKDNKPPDPNVNSIERQSSKSPVDLPKISTKGRKPPSSKVTIDLTGDEKHDNARSPLGAASASSTMESTKPSSPKKSRRSLPWTRTDIILGQSSPGHEAQRKHVVKPPNMNLQPPISCKSPKAGAGPHVEDEPGGWWQDDNTPFNSFMKSYKAIRPGNGNSYAKSKSASEAKEPNELHETKKRAKRMKGIDYLSWEL